jgi:hypothetical protein
MKVPSTILITLNSLSIASNRPPVLANPKLEKDVEFPLGREPLVVLVCVDKSLVVDDLPERDLRADRTHSTDDFPSLSDSPLDLDTPRKFTTSSSWTNSMLPLLEAPATVSVKRNNNVKNNKRFSCVDVNVHCVEYGIPCVYLHGPVC